MTKKGGFKNALTSLIAQYSEENGIGIDTKVVQLRLAHTTQVSQKTGLPLDLQQFLPLSLRLIIMPNEESVQKAKEDLLRESGKADDTAFKRLFNNWGLLDLSQNPQGQKVLPKPFYTKLINFLQRLYTGYTRETGYVFFSPLRQYVTKKDLSYIVRRNKKVTGIEAEHAIWKDRFKEMVKKFKALDDSEFDLELKLEEIQLESAERVAPRPMTKRPRIEATCQVQKKLQSQELVQPRPVSQTNVRIPSQQRVSSCASSSSNDSSDSVSICSRASSPRSCSYSAYSPSSQRSSPYPTVVVNPEFKNLDAELNDATTILPPAPKRSRIDPYGQPYGYGTYVEPQGNTVIPLTSLNIEGNASSTYNSGLNPNVVLYSGVDEATHNNQLFSNFDGIYGPFDCVDSNPLFDNLSGASPPWYQDNHWDSI